MNKEHLTMLADYLDALPDDYEHFDMEVIYDNTFIGYKLSNPLNAKKLGLECGTIACVMGHTPLVSNMPHPHHDESWSNYVERVYSLEMDEDYWCFSSAWKFKDNTHKGAAARVRQLVSDGLPDDWYEQIHRPSHPLSYTVHLEKDSD